MLMIPADGEAAIGYRFDPTDECESYVRRSNPTTSEIEIEAPQIDLRAQLLGGFIHDLQILMYAEQVFDGWPQTRKRFDDKASLSKSLFDVVSANKYLLSSSINKTVRLCMGNSSCLKVFSRSDIVSYFISGSLDAKVCIWSIPYRQVVDWNDLHEMVTAACYTPDGQGALVGTYKGNCYLYNTSEV